MDTCFAVISSLRPKLLALCAALTYLARGRLAGRNACQRKKLFYSSKEKLLGTIETLSPVLENALRSGFDGAWRDFGEQGKAVTSQSLRVSGSMST